MSASDRISAYCYTRSAVVDRSVCLMVTFVSPAKTAEPIEMPFRELSRVGPRNHVLDEGQGRTNLFVPATGEEMAMRRFIYIL